jgi:hypothetical protein
MAGMRAAMGVWWSAGPSRLSWYLQALHRKYLVT